MASYRPVQGTLSEGFEQPVSPDKLDGLGQPHHEGCLSREELEQNAICKVQQSLNSADPQAQCSIPPRIQQGIKPARAELGLNTKATGIIDGQEVYVADHSTRPSSGGFSAPYEITYISLRVRSEHEAPPALLFPHLSQGLAHTNLE
ncbi:hypothetical protein PG991_014964 [Apiospora marii]|uniref:Uncharacterized protein n=1 Tax=Apiospora marii TaxID=335849 RepID=A0ABR1R2Q7_9PEZI